MNPRDDLFRALADPTRRLILDELCKRDEQTLFELCGRLAMAHGITSSRQAISQHLTVLEEAGLVVTDRRGRTKVHWFDGTPLAAITERWPVPAKRASKRASTQRGSAQRVSAKKRKKKRSTK